LGSALAFTKENSRIVCYRAEKNVSYSPESFRGSASFWLSLDPSEIPQQYSDPFQVTDKDYNNDCIWIDFTKNDRPSDFRLGVFGDQSVWDPKDLHQYAEEFFFRLLRVTEPPFASGSWTHVVVTWDGITVRKMDAESSISTESDKEKPPPFPNASIGISRRPPFASARALSSACWTTSRCSIGR